MTISSINGTETLGVHMKINEIRHISITVQNLIQNDQKPQYETEMLIFLL